jgi:L-rhamnose mutarotase
MIQLLNCRFLFSVLLLFMTCLSCGKKPSVGETKDLVFIVNLVNDEQKVKEYLAYHQKIWPEVEAGFRKAGYKKINLYRYNNSLVMIVTIPKNADINEMGRLAEGYDIKCKEWNRRMAGYQAGVSGTAEGQKWVQADLMYSFSNP